MRLGDDLLWIEGALLGPGGIKRGRVSLRCRGEAKAPPEAVWSLRPDQLLIPGFHDHHTHFVSAFRAPQGPDLHGCLSRESCLAEVALWLRRHPGAQPVLGEGWDESVWDDPRPPLGSDLDRIDRERPIALRRVCGHRAVINTAAWRLIDPRGAEADPMTGSITESLALTLAQRWPSPRAALVEGIVRGQSVAFREGVVAIDEMGRLETYEALRSVEESGRLLMRVDHYFPLDALPDLLDRGIRPERRTGPLRVAGLKAFLDGSIGARTAAVGAGYADGRGAGMLLRSTPELIEAVGLGVDEGYCIALHAIGERAVEQALLAFETVRPRTRPGSALRIEHAEQMDDRAIERAESAGVTLSMQPNFAARWQGPGQMYERALGRDRALRLNRFASAARAGRLLFGSDMMPFGPLAGLPGALDHPDPAESLALAPALKAYAAAGRESGEGPDAPSEAPALDLAVLSFEGGDPLEALKSRRARVVWTAAWGVPVHSEPDAGIPEAFRAP
ncbi:MAG: amidohydrolase family protein [Candidatus Eisenbacteria bacterium]|nr:amidohydrolase family protein [Candidatus Eisenbacteria bacterium]